jgi:hypothetical protein
VKPASPQSHKSLFAAFSAENAALSVTSLKTTIKPLGIQSVDKASPPPDNTHSRSRGFEIIDSLCHEACGLYDNLDTMRQNEMRPER